MKIIGLTPGDRLKFTYVIVMVTNEQTHTWIEAIVFAYCEVCCVPQHRDLLHIFVSEWQRYLVA